MTTLFRPLHPRALPALLVLLLLACSWLTASAQATKRSFDIPAGRAEVTLKAFAEQAGAQFFFSAEKVGGVRTAPVKGEFAAREALDWMLKDSGLVAVQDEKTGALSVRRDDSPNAPRAAQTDRERPGDQGKVEDGKLVLDKFEVFGSKSVNLDLPRTRNDAQPYVVFDRAQLTNSQASNIQDFFRTRLPMNTAVGLFTFTGGTAVQQTVNLRGLGNNQTLILVDGRRLPPLALAGTLNMSPPDIGGIPLESIERIEVLPSTASGIYGGGATGGVINIITRKDYSGVDLTLNYVNTFDTDTARRRADLNASTSLRGGATMITLTASWQDANDLLTQDRDFAVRARQLAFANNPAAFTGTSTPPLGYTTNIRSQNGANLVLKPQYGGTVLSSAFTSVPVGYAGIASDNAAALVANAGRYNLDLPDDLRGRRSNLITKASPVTAFGLGLRQKITPWLEGYVDFQRNSNYMHNAQISGFPASATLAATAPNNPFTTAVNVSFPITGNLWNNNTFETVTSRATGGLVAKLPHEWQAGLDYVWGRTTSHIRRDASVLGDPDGPTGPGISYSTALSTGALDVMRDLNSQPLNYTPYLMPGMVLDDRLKSTNQSLTVRASGPTIRLPAGPLVVSASVDWQETWNAPAVSSFVNTSAPTPNYGYTPWLSTSAESGYLEARVPLLAAAERESKQTRLELQLAGRYDRSHAHTLVSSNYDPFLSSPTGPFPDVPRRTREFKATSYTAGLRYAPVTDIVLRASVGTGFLAPDVSQLLPAPAFTNTFLPLVDRKRGGVLATTGPLAFIGGGNPDLKPENSKSYSGGFIYTPRFLPGFRLSVDYTRIEKTDEITNLSFQQALDYEDLLPGLVTRATLTPADQAAGYTGGVITQVNVASVNFARREVEAVDLQADYTRKTSIGEFRGYAVATWNRRFAAKVASTDPLLNQIGYLGSPLKWRGNAGLDWSRGPWSAGWNAQFYDSQLVYSFAARATAAGTVLTQGGSRFPAQVYHDLMVSYQFGRHPEGWRRIFSGVKLSVGLQNVFDREPPLAAGTVENAGFQNIEDPRLRRYSFTLRKHF